MSATDTSVSLEERVALLQAELNKRNASGFKAKLKKVAVSIAAALTTPEAIKAEKYIGVVVLTRLVILVPAVAVTADFVIGLLGGPSVKP